MYVSQPEVPCGQGYLRRNPVPNPPLDAIIAASVPDKTPILQLQAASQISTAAFQAETHLCVRGCHWPPHSGRLLLDQNHSGHLYLLRWRSPRLPHMSAARPARLLGRTPPAECKSGCPSRNSGIGLPVARHRRARSNPNQHCSREYPAG